MKVTVQCAYCGKDVTRHACQMAGKKRIFCSQDCMAKFRSKRYNPAKYRTFISLEGYADRLRPFNTKYNTESKSWYPKTGTRLTHRIVMEQYLGRPLLRTEVVHHKDGDKQNNSVENLQLFANHHEHALWHAEQRKREAEANVL